MRCVICNQDHATHDPMDNNWYCQECFDSIEDTLNEYEDLEEFEWEYLNG